MPFPARLADEVDRPTSLTGPDVAGLSLPGDAFWFPPPGEHCPPCCPFQRLPKPGPGIDPSLLVDRSWSVLLKKRNRPE